MVTAAAASRLWDILPPAQPPARALLQALTTLATPSPVTGIPTPHTMLQKPPLCWPQVLPRGSLACCLPPHFSLSASSASHSSPLTGVPIPTS